MIRREIDIFLTALMFYTRIPVHSRLNYTYDPSYLQASSRYFPLIGWIVGGMAGITYWLAQQWWPISISVMLSMGLSIIVTGALHEDGWADVCDGFGGGFTKARVLAIMKDSQLGSYGSIGLIFVLGLKAVSLIELSHSGELPLFLFVAHSVSRLAAISLVYTHEYVRSDETSKAEPLANKIGGGSMIIATLFGLLPLLLLSPQLWFTLAGVVIVTLGMTRWFVQRIGGYTGDCLGAVQQMTELIFYLWLVGLLR